MPGQRLEMTRRGFVTVNIIPPFSVLLYYAPFNSKNVVLGVQNATIAVFHPDPGVCTLKICVSVCMCVCECVHVCVCVGAQNIS